MAALLRIEHTECDGALVLRPRGVLDMASYASLRVSLVKAATDEPRALVVDLDGLVVPDPAAYALFSSVSTQLAEWPGLPLLLAAGEERQRTAVAAYRLSRFVPVHPSVPAALAAIDDPPPRRLTRCNLPNSLSGAPLARKFVREVCRRWAVTEADEVIMIANELVENTLIHTYCAPSLRLELRRGLLTVAVYDDDPALAELREPETSRWGQGGLALVAGLSTTWGCSPTLMGGKVVWAVLRS